MSRLGQSMMWFDIVNNLLSVSIIKLMKNFLLGNKIVRFNQVI